MLGADESLLYVLTAGDKKRGRASLAVWRTTHHGWMSQHLVCENNPYASRAVMLAAAAGAIRKGSDLSAQNWFRPENRFPSGVRFDGADHRRASLVSAKACVFRFAQNTIAAHGKPNSHRTVQSIAQRSAFGNRFGRARKHLCRGGRATAGRRIQCCRRTVSQCRAAAHTACLAGLSGQQRRTIGAAIVYRGPLGVNFSYLENRCDLLLHPTFRIRSFGVASSLLSALRPRMRILSWVKKQVAAVLQITEIDA